MLDSLSTLNLFMLFLFSSFCIWISGVKITQITDVIDNQFGLGQRFGGLILLAIVTNLPEIAIVIGAGITNHMAIAIGNIIGGIAVQTVVFVILDGIGLRSKGVLFSKPITLEVMLEGLSVLLILLLTIMGTQLPKSMFIWRIAPAELAILAAWIISLLLVRKASHYLPWQKRIKQHETKKTFKYFKKFSPTFNIILFLLLAIFILLTGLLLEESSNALANKIGFNSALFGATILAGVTSLPEVSTGLAAIKLKDYTLAISDIFGGNAFLPVLFLLGTLISGTPTLNQFQKSDIYLAGLGAILTIIYLFSLVFGSKRNYLWLGLDSIIVLCIYFIGMGGLFFIGS